MIDGTEGPKTNSNSNVYIGTKIVKAEPMTSLDFKKSKGFSISNEEDSHGYKVTYEDGYISWSPKEVFERCYRLITSSEKSLLK